MELFRDSEIILNLSKILRLGKISHSYLFFGEDGVGKKKIARLFAKAILCENKSFFCKRCFSCLKFSSLNHPDFLEIGENSFKGQSFNIETVRKLIEDSFVIANEGNFKVFILNNVDRLEKYSSNALLKILEEPPKNVVFILTAKNKNNVLKTIVSRCVNFYVAPFKPEKCFQFLKEKEIEIEKESLKEVVKFGQGRIYFLEKLLLKKENKDVLKTSKKLFDIFLKGEEFEFNCVIQKFENNIDFLFLVLDCFLLRLLFYLENLEEIQCEDISMFLKLLEIFEEVLNNLKNNGNIPLTLSYFCANIFSIKNKINSKLNL